MKFTNPISEEIWKDRYQHNDETLDDNLKRVAKFCSNNEREYQEFYNLMDKGLFFPAGRPMSNAYEGTKLTLNNCFIEPSIEDDLMEIFEAVKISAKVQQLGGGIGNDFSLLRPKGTVTSRGAIASGVISFMDVFNAATNTVKSHNRRGANMGCLSIRHPDIYDFITAKANDTSKLNYFNISVMVDDDFLYAVENDEETWLHWPVYDDKFKIITDESKWQIKKKIKAKELWNEILKQAYDTGEPGVLFYDSMNRDNNISYAETITATNPCGEYLAGTVFDKSQGKQGGACNLGSLFLHNYVLNPFSENAVLDKNLLKQSIYSSVRFLDNIIDKNNYPLPMFEIYQKNFRTIGLGITGLGNMLMMLGLRYGSKESLEYVDDLMDFISYWTYKASIALAKEKGAFPYFKADKFCEVGYLAKKAEKDNKWHILREEVRQYGIRNARMVVIAPTGTLSMVFGNNCSSGVEPVFSLAYDRRVHVGGQEDENIKIISFKDYAYDLAEKMGKPIDKNVFVTALELPVEDHVNMLKIVAYHSDSSISKTINIPEDYPFEDTKKVYMDCWKGGVKGCTIFRPNPIRYGILIDPNEKKKEENTTAETVIKNNNLIQYDSISPIEKEEIGTTYGSNVKKVSSCGKLHINIARDRQGHIAEVYVSGSKGGICMANINAISRLTSLALRSGIKVSEIVDQLRGIDCKACSASKARGIQLDGISCPDIIGKALQNEYKEGGQWLVTSEKTELVFKEINKKEEEKILQEDRKCPECGEPIANNGGCVICLSCGWTKCE